MATEVLCLRFDRFFTEVWVLCVQLTAKDHLRFQTSYATVLKAHMDSLKKKEKRDKKDKKTTAAKASAS